MAHRLLQLAYQPKVECASGALGGFETLVRWMHPSRGLIMPDRFVPLTEAHGLIDVTTDWVLDKALKWFCHCLPVTAAIPPGKSPSGVAANILLSINVSARSLKDLQFVDQVTACCEKHGIKPERVIFELTETSAMGNPVTSLTLLTRLRMKGFYLSIDDFGTGYSSMLQLVRMPFSEIKVDKSFVMTAMQSQESRTVVNSIIELGHSLGLRVTAEGVEDAVTLDYLKSAGCDLAQGYFIAPPMDGDEVARWMAGRWK